MKDIVSAGFRKLCQIKTYDQVFKKRTYLYPRTEFFGKKYDEVFIKKRP